MQSPSCWFFLYFLGRIPEGPGGSPIGTPTRDPGSPHVAMGWVTPGRVAMRTNTSYTSPHCPAHEHVPLPTVSFTENAGESPGNHQEINFFLPIFRTFLGRPLVIITGTATTTRTPEDPPPPKRVAATRRTPFKALNRAFNRPIVPDVSDFSDFLGRLHPRRT